MLNTITLDAVNTGTFAAAAARYAYTPALRKIVDGCFGAALRSDNRFFVLENDIVRAAQTTLVGAMQYMDDTRVLVDCSAVTPTWHARCADVLLNCEWQQQLVRAGDWSTSAGLGYQFFHCDAHSFNAPCWKR